MGLWPRFFPLTSTFFGLTSNYKKTLLEEVHICTEHLKNTSYTDVMRMPVYERRFKLNLLINKTEQQQEQQSTTKNTGKGSRTRTISGAALKSKLRSGEIPNT